MVEVEVREIKGIRRTQSVTAALKIELAIWKEKQAAFWSREQTPGDSQQEKKDLIPTASK